MQVLPAALALAGSPALQGAALRSLRDFFAALPPSGHPAGRVDALRPALEAVGTAGALGFGLGLGLVSGFGLQVMFGPGSMAGLGKKGWLAPCPRGVACARLRGAHSVSRGKSRAVSLSLAAQRHMAPG
jgi:hypothetical protein